MDHAASSTAERSLQHVVDRLADSGDVGKPISPEVRRSWRRSAEAGLIPHRIHAPYDPGVDADGRLWWAAAPVLAPVSQDLAGSEVALLLADDAGHVIQRWAPKSIAGEMDSIGAAPGFVCQEKFVGTNSIGLAIRSGTSSTVMGWEHYADGLTAVSCAAGVVTDPVTGRLLGAVNLTCTAGTYSPVMPALIGRIVHETQQRLAADSGDARVAALQHAFLRERRRGRGPVAAVDGHRMFVNSAAALILTPADREVLWQLAQSQLRAPTPAASSIVVLALGTQLVRYAVVHDGEAVAGALAWFGQGGQHQSMSGPSGDRPTGWGALTDSEQRIAVHVARGLTNRETASQVFVSPHTVDYHLRQIFRKLDLRSRVELARFVTSIEKRGDDQDG